jgi:hypothetical protein
LSATRRDDDAAAAARVSDGLASRFGKANLFIDVDSLYAGQRFDEELATALAACDVLIAVIGQRWMDLLKAKITSGERDYVRDYVGDFGFDRAATVAHGDAAVTGEAFVAVILASL